MTSSSSPGPGSAATEAMLRQLDRMRRRLADARPGAAGGSDRFEPLMQELLEDLHAVLEEALVSEEELRERNEALTESRLLLEAERERYHSLFEMAPDPYLVTDGAGSIREANRAACRILRSDPVGLAGRPLHGWIAEEDARAFSRLLGRVRRRGRAEDFGLHLRVDGAPLAVSASVAVHGTREDRLLWLIRDIRERREAEANRVRLGEERAARGEAEAARQRIVNILESISDAFVALDRDARITYMNRRAEQLLQRPRAELLGRVAWECFPELLGTTFEREYLRATALGESVAFEEFYAPGRTWIELHAVPTPDGLTIYFRNITRRKEAESVQRFLGEVSDELAGSIDLRETLQRVTRLAVPKLGDMCMVYLLGAQGELRRAAAAHADPSKQEALDELLSATPVRSDATRSPVVRVVRSGEPELVPELDEAELIGYALDADHLHLLRLLAPRSMIAVPLISRGRTLGAISLACSEDDRCYDEADLALARELARRAALALDNARLYAEARDASRARQDILHVVSHDLRNALNALLLNLDILLVDAEPAEGGDGGRPQLQSIQRSALHMERLVRDLLDVENLETGRFAVHPQAVDAGALIAEAIQMLRPLASERRIELAAAADPDLPTVRADPNRLQQVLVNLIGNAVKFTPPGGRVTVSAEPLPTRAGGVCVSVTDTGIGIAEGDLPHVFDRYWQGEKSRTSGRGAGLGLAISRAIIEAHRGTLKVESRPGEGSTFRFTLPAAT
jgi:PAS domain S-box-containing protein